MTIDELLDEVHAMLDKAWSLPLSGGKCAVDADRLRDIVDDIRANMPSEIRQAKAIVADRDYIISSAREEAEQRIRKAEERVRVMVDQEEIVKQAQQKASDLLNQAQQQSREMRKNANDFAEDVLRRSEETLTKRAAEIRQARQSIRRPSLSGQTEE